ncbi:MAG: thioesterase family protein [Muribaculaceae bacterium]|nr:thioesterase family protein [Muribaculaceae bacterium]
MTSEVSYTSVVTVTEANTAQAMSSGDLPVFATPALAAVMENAAMLAARQLCDKGQTTVGSSIEVKHLSPSPIGATVFATATLTGQEGRRLTFDIVAKDNDKTIGTAVHSRYIVNIERFMNKL